MDHPIPKSTQPSPFSPYDILGYFLPAVAMLVSIVVFENLLEETGRQSIRPVLDLVETLDVRELTGTASVVWLTIGLFFLYLLGHVISGISSIAIDRVLVARIYGYPYQSLLFPAGAITYKSTSAQFWMSLFFWANAYLLVRYFVTANIADLFSWLSVLKEPARVAAYWCGVLLAGMLVAKLLIQWAVLWLRERPLCKEFAMQLSYWLLHVPFAVLAAPYKVVAGPLALLLQTRRGMEPKFTEQFRVEYRKQFGLVCPEDGPVDGGFDSASDDSIGQLTNLYWMPAIFVADNRPFLHATLQHWLRLYAFSRNACVAFYLSFIYCLVSATVNNAVLDKGGRMLALIPFALLVMACVMLVRYYYLYYGYYSKYLFRAFVYSSRDAGSRGGVGVREGK